MKALITGSEGFVGRYLSIELQENGYEVVGLDIQSAPHTLQVDLLNVEQTKAVIAQQQPDVIFHLAGQADVGRSWREPQLTMSLNVTAAINLMEAVRIYCPKARMVMVGSSDQYGRLGDKGVNVDEHVLLSPQSPYAISKRAQEDMAMLYVHSYGLNICMTRSFNHGGAGQRPGFMLSDFASGIAKVECGLEKVLRVGNLTARRDFTHVKDVVRAYRLLAEKGISGEVYNVGSGVTYRAQEVLDMFIDMATCPIEVCQDPARMRPSDTPIICCNHEKLTKDTGWEPQIAFSQIVEDSLMYYRQIYSNISSSDS